MVVAKTVTQNCSERIRGQEVIVPVYVHVCYAVSVWALSYEYTLQKSIDCRRILVSEGGCKRPGCRGRRAHRTFSRCHSCCSSPPPSPSCPPLSSARRDGQRWQRAAPGASLQRRPHAMAALVSTQLAALEQTGNRCDNLVVCSGRELRFVASDAASY